MRASVLPLFPHVHPLHSCMPPLPPQVLYVSAEDIPAEVYAREKEIEMGREDLKSKPEAIRAKIAGAACVGARGPAGGKCAVYCVLFQTCAAMRYSKRQGCGCAVCAIKGARWALRWTYFVLCTCCVRVWARLIG